MESTSKDSLANIVADNLPISIEEAEFLIEGIEKGYEIGMFTPYALAVRDRAISRLSKDNKRLEKILERYYGHLLYDENGNRLY